MALGYTRRTGTLPLEVTGFVGRVSELDHVRELLRRSRLTTLIGPGGVGKSRLALRTALSLKGDYDDGVVLVELSALHDPELLTGAVANALGLPEQSGRVVVDVVVEHLAERRILLVLDTCEHLLDACALLADLLLREAPGVTVLATSRQPLDVPGEHTLPVPPLGDDDAVELFAQRASAVVPGFEVTDNNRPDVLALCHRLDGIPLAIELATVRLRALPLTQLTARLEHRFQVLTGGRRSAVLPRHQTLRTAIDWSYELCSPQEKLLWARLSVFAGSFDLTAVEEVCSEDEADEPDEADKPDKPDKPGDAEPGESPEGDATGLLPREVILEHLIGLVDKSVVLRDGDEGARYRLLDTIREYGADKCSDTERERCRRRHRDHYLGRASYFFEMLLSAEQVPLYWQLHRDLADLRSALEYSLSRPDGVRPALVMAARLWPFWSTAGLFTEGRYWLDKGLAQEREPSRERSQALLWGSLLAVMQGDVGVAHAGFLETMEVAHAAGSELDRMLALGYLGGISWLFGDADGGRESLTEALSGLVRIGDPLGRVVHHYQSSYVQALIRRSDDSDAHADEALRLITEAPGGGVGECMITSQVLGIKGMAAWTRGDAPESVRFARESLRLSRELRDHFAATNSLELLAWGSADTGRHKLAAWLLGTCSEQWRKIGSPMIGVAIYQDDHSRVETTVRDRLGEAEYRLLFEQGSTLPLEQAVELALAGASRPVTSAAPSEGTSSLDHLTRREREVAALISAGLTNREISERLVISKRTADAHVEHILAKLGFSSRTQIAALAGEAANATGTPWLRSFDGRRQ
ncbi:LuxR C-terminal-related transcriptional regulator [Streptomyces sp. NBC_00237]|uniref:ATP-binding protein n=1 Tax=Streptomyces sp. NBC_00237 TaxID=2975687 RepID=UPI0022510B65|nr:LuxR C-terminal-related transcriptional regulator [Streptomyces sp. NBC_00237]MCX5200217.1 LuxR C-terminal-related transcriptional regulator [Streptomyces sp. NBC_00237]